MNILVLNAGSATLKYKLFQMPEETMLAEGAQDTAAGDAIVAAAEAVIGECEKQGVDAVGHRVVHGGALFTEPTLVTDKVMEGLRGLRDLDPLHNPTETALIDAARRRLPGAPSVAVFDTAFHRTLPEVAWRYALPRELSDRLRLRRYGFHGLSHQYVSGQLLQRIGRTPEGTKLVTCHLGSGSSVCAIVDGKSVDTSMGLTPLEGLAMGTRCGDIDPGLLLYVLRTQKMSVEALEDLLNHQSGLAGLSGGSGDVRDLEGAAASGDARAELALEIFAYRVRKYIGAYAAAMGGLDAVAFTGGIGEHSPKTRERITRGLEFLGLHMDGGRNGAASGREAAQMSTDDSAVKVWMIPTDEERQIAREAGATLRASS